MATLTDFDKFYQAALASKIKLQDYFDRIAHQASTNSKDKANPPEITPEQDGLEAIVLKPSLHLGLSSVHQLHNTHDGDVKSAQLHSNIP